jgi:hypothetical protein
MDATNDHFGWRQLRAFAMSTSVGREGPLPSRNRRIPVVRQPVARRVFPGEVAEIAGKIAHGVIGGQEVVGDGQYENRGEFGTVSIIAERPIPRLTGP